MSRVFVATEYGDPQHQAFADRPVPGPRDGEMTIEVHAAGVNPADWKRREGLFGTSDDLPLAMGWEAAGIIVALGPGVNRFEIGDRVVGFPARGLGAFAEHTVLAATSAAHVPTGVSFTDAAALPVAGTTAYDLTHQLAARRGDTLMVLGAGGGVGRMVLQFANDLGLRVIGIASESKRDIVEAGGATFVRSGADAADLVRNHVPSGADFLIDLVGGSALRELVPAVRHGSSIVSAADAETAQELGGQGRKSQPESLQRVIAAVSNGALDPNVVATYSLNDATEAMAAVESGHARGKVVIVI